ncbi:hypothetical protein [Streptomyces griseoaurantiacus]|uniref:hypothetical protein n=1 Tax=Streptomyces griseoaurantiacus TaxID=68213 RepID=UPI00380665A7
MIKKIARVSCLPVLTAALLASAPAQAALAHAGTAAPLPAPSAGAPGAPLVGGLLGSLAIGHPVTSLRTLVPTEVLGR